MKDKRRYSTEKPEIHSRTDYNMFRTIT